MRNYVERFYLYKGYAMAPEVLTQISYVRIRFSWGEFRVSIVQKRGFAPVKFLDKTSFWLHGLHN